MLLCKYYNDDCVKFSDNYEGQFDSIVTDPPYGIEYLGNDWDSYQNCIAFKKSTWESISKPLKPGGYLLIFGASKTFHRLTCAVEDSGLKIRDVLMWLYGQGMPKSQNIGKKDPAWEGWGTGLKPCYEPILLAQKPISEKTIVKNCQEHGVGAINIEESRLESGRWAGNVLHDGNVWYRFDLAEADIIVPVTLNSMSILNSTFMNCYLSQKDASFPSYEYDGPFCELSQKIWVEQHHDLQLLLGRDYWYRNENPHLRAVHGAVYLKEMDVDTFLGVAREIEDSTEVSGILKG